MYNGQKACWFRGFFGGGGGGGGEKSTHQTFTRGGSAPRSSPLPFYIRFLTETILSIDKWNYPFDIPSYNLLKITASCQTNISLRVMSNVTKNKTQLWRNVSGLKLSSRFSLIQVCLSISPFVFAVLSISTIFHVFSDVLSGLFYVLLSLVMVPSVWMLINLTIPLWSDISIFSFLFHSKIRINLGFWETAHLPLP